MAFYLTFPQRASKFRFLIFAKENLSLITSKLKVNKTVRFVQAAFYFAEKLVFFNKKCLKTKLKTLTFVYIKDIII